MSTVPRPSPNTTSNDVCAVMLYLIGEVCDSKVSNCSCLLCNTVCGVIAFTATTVFHTSHNMLHVMYCL